MANPRADPALEHLWAVLIFACQVAGLQSLFFRVCCRPEGVLMTQIQRPACATRECLPLSSRAFRAIWLQGSS
jgi:hypothetical protein